MVNFVKVTSNILVFYVLAVAIYYLKFLPGLFNYYAFCKAKFYKNLHKFYALLHMFTKSKNAGFNLVLATY